MQHRNNGARDSARLAERERGGQEKESEKGKLKPEDIKFLTKLFYGLIGTASSLIFFLALYWVLRLDSAITNIVTNTYGAQAKLQNSAFGFFPKNVRTSFKKFDSRW